MAKAARNRVHEQLPASPAGLVEKAWNRMRTVPRPSCPYKIGEAVMGDDPFNGRHDGVVVSLSGTSVGVKTSHGILFYDHRQLKRLD
ncbi:hypothetical protein F8G81_02820 [Arthrobacter sp. CDRTa11]|uniref:hypothetical protein n=1 Tax=Arthrobacter sp. CDRTa11 TaxID=2651199 RepID=UPI002265D825|nr:hypothetical protein [Arthrobacter sp. CDRTa11]UZX01674.1 hypothetical protein F8G81_02820 [Arthrobacter sp. CDRTa11]